MYRTMLVAVDGSATGSKAFDAAVDLAREYGAELYVLTVAQSLNVADDVETEAVVENSLEFHRKLLLPLKQIALDKGVKAHFEAVAGHPAEQIVYHADRHKADLVIVGNRGRSKIARLLLGSVSEYVVKYADRPVMVVR